MKALILIIKLWNLQFNLKMTQWWRAESIYQFLGISIEIGTEHWYVIATHTTLPFNMTGFSLPSRRVSNCRAFAVVGAVLSPPPVNVHRGTVWECDSQCLLHRCTALLPFRVDYFEGLSVPGLTPYLFRHYPESKWRSITAAIQFKFVPYLIHGARSGRRELSGSWWVLYALLYGLLNCVIWCDWHFLSIMAQIRQVAVERWSATQSLL